MSELFVSENMLFICNSLSWKGMLFEVVIYLAVANVSVIFIRNTIIGYIWPFASQAFLIFMKIKWVRVI